MPGNMKKKPPYFDNVEYYEIPEKDEEVKEEETIHEESPNEFQLPDMLPPCCELLKRENGITEDKPPKSCPCFTNWKDPHLAAIVNVLIKCNCREKSYGKSYNMYLKTFRVTSEKHAGTMGGH